MLGSPTNVSFKKHFRVFSYQIPKSVAYCLVSLEAIFSQKLLLNFPVKSIKLQAMMDLVAIGMWSGSDSTLDFYRGFSRSTLETN